MNPDRTERQSLREAAPTPEGLLSFIPPILYRWPEFARIAEHQVVVLFIDIAGFTAHIEALNQRGAEGAERLEREVARVFDHILDVTDRFNGLPIKVSGDALTVVFPIQRSGLLEAALRALAAADLLCIPPQPTPESAQWELSLSYKIGIGAGTMLSGVVGDPTTRAEYIFTGSAIERAVAAERHARPGEAWVSAETAELFRHPSWWSESSVDGFHRLRRRENTDRQEAWRQTLPPPTPSPETAALTIERYQALIPEAVRAHAVRGTLEYLRRHQHLTVVFAGCPGLKLDSSQAIHQLDAHYRLMGQVIASFGGFLSEFEAGDKGAKLIVLFGAPVPLEDHVNLAVRCAQAMQREARQLGVVPAQRLGIATGRLYVGRIGCQRLSKYSALGDRMNVAARLMALAAPWTVLAEQEVSERSRQVASWSEPQVLQVRGKVERVTASYLLQTTAPAGLERRGLGVVGRVKEREALKCSLESTLRGQGQLVFLEGDPGLGKTRLLSYLAREAAARGLPRILQWQAAANVRPLPLNPWRGLLLDLMDCSEQSELPLLEARFEHWRDTLSPRMRPASEALAPLVSLPHYGTRLVNRLSHDQLRALRIQLILECLLLERETPRAILMDDADHLDEDSVELLRQLHPRLASLPLLLVLSHRPGTPTDAGFLSSLDGLEPAVRIRLDRLPIEEVEALALRRLRAQSMTLELRDFLCRRAQGNPLHIDAWLDFLSRERQIELVEGVASLRQDLASGSLPEQLETLALRAIEQLPPDAQLSVRVAATFAGSFTAAEVAQVHPETIPEEVVRAHLLMAAREDILWADRQKAGRHFFARQETREAIHDSLPFQLRRLLHARHIQRLLQSPPDSLQEQGEGIAWHQRFLLPENQVRTAPRPIPPEVAELLSAAPLEVRH